jgi:hypothetical protein
VGNLEGSTGPRWVVQSLWSGAAAAVHRLACPRPVSGTVSHNARDSVDVGLIVADLTMRRAPAGGRPGPPARRNVDKVLRVLHDDKTAGTGRIAARPGSAPRTLGTRR